MFDAIAILILIELALVLLFSLAGGVLFFVYLVKILKESRHAKREKD